MLIWIFWTLSDYTQTESPDIDLGGLCFYYFWELCEEEFEEGATMFDELEYPSLVVCHRTLRRSCALKRFKFGL
jgi:hypothetical protein